MRTLNIRFAIITASCILVLGLGIWGLHAYQLRRNTGFFRSQAAASKDKYESEKKKDPTSEATAKAREEYSTNLNWYLNMHPEDFDALEEYVTIFLDSPDEMSSAMLGFVYNTLSKIVREDERPDASKRIATRRKLIELCLSKKVRQFRDAQTHIQALLKNSKLQDDPKLLGQLGVCQFQNGDAAAGVETLKKAIELGPNEVSNYLVLADILRVKMENPTEADEWMEKMVKANPTDFDAQASLSEWIRVTNCKPIEEALEHAESALKIKPDDRAALYLVAHCALMANKSDRAREAATKGVEKYPETAAFYNELMLIELKAGRLEKAAEILQKGLKAVKNSGDLLWRLTSVYIDQGKLDEAKAALARYYEIGDRPEKGDYLKGRILISEAKWAEAVEAFEKSRPSFLTRDAMDQNILKQLDYFLGKCYGSLRNSDKQIAALRRAVKADPQFIVARWELIEALTRQNQLQDALQEYAQLMRFTGDSTPIMLPYIRTLIRYTLTREPSERDWKPVEALLDKYVEDHPEVVQALVYRGEIYLAQDRLDDAEKVLAKAQKKAPKDLMIRVAPINLANRRRQWEKSEGLLKNWESDLGDSVDLRAAKAFYYALRYGQESVSRIKDLQKDVDKFSEEDRDRLSKTLSYAARQSGSSAFVQEMSQAEAQKNPQSLDSQFELFDQAAKAKDVAKMSELIKIIEKIEGRGPIWKYCQAAIWTYEAGNTDEAKLRQALALLQEAKKERPSFGKVTILLAGIYDQLQDFDQALKYYLEGIDQGETRSYAIRRSMTILLSKQRYAEAERLLQSWDKQQLSLPPETLKSWAGLLLRQGDTKEALERARSAVKADSKDYLDYLWLGQVVGTLSIQAKAENQKAEYKELFEEASKAFRHAIELNEKAPETWVTLVKYLAETEHLGDAEGVIDEAQKKIAPDKLALALAQCYEAIGKSEKASNQYKDALAAHPDDIVVIRTLADFYQRTGSVKEAEALFRRIIDKKVKCEESDLHWARRQLASLLVARGGYSDKENARKLIEENLSSINDAVDQRMKATMDAMDPQKSKRDEAVKTLEKLLNEQQATPEDRYRLAMMYLNAGDWPNASNMFRELVSTSGKEPKYYAAYINALIAHGESASAKTYLMRLAELAPDNMATVVLQAESEFSQGNYAQALDLLKSFVDRPKAVPADRATRLLSLAQMSEKFGTTILAKAGKSSDPKQKSAAQRCYDAAENYFVQYVKERPSQTMELVGFYGRQGRVNDALKLFEDGYKKSDPYSISQVSLLLSQVGRGPKEDVERVEKVLTDAEKEFNDSSALAMAMSIIRLSQERYDEAETILRAIIAKNAGHSLAMNNLAYVLSLRKKDLNDALKFAERAIEINGPVASLLDTRAYVYIAQGNATEALKDLEQALNETKNPEWLFHKAMAYDVAGQNNNAAKTMAEALEAGYSREQTATLERAIFDKLAKSAEKYRPTGGK